PTRSVDGDRAAPTAERTETSADDELAPRPERSADGESAQRSETSADDESAEGQPNAEREADNNGAPRIAAAELKPLAPPELELPSDLAILPSRDAVLYPGMLLPFQVSDPRWVRLLSDAVSARQPVGLFLQHEPTAEVTQLAGLHHTGTAANIVRLLKLPDGTLQVLLQGAARIQVGETATQTTPYLRAVVTVVPAQSE